MNQHPSKLSEHTCPWWLIFTFDNPLRKLIHNPKTILGEYINPGDTVLDVGCGMGYFSLAIAELVGLHGCVIAADLQEKMLAGLQKRAVRAGLQNRIQTHLSQPDRIGVEVPLDFVLAFWMVHEVRGKEKFLQELYTQLRSGCKLLIVEPKIHVSKRDFEKTIQLSHAIGFTVTCHPGVRASRTVVLSKTT